MSNFTTHFEHVLNNQNLSTQASEAMMSEIMSGELSSEQIAGFLSALRTKGETVDEISGLARIMRQKATPIKHSCDKIIDTCGTGGDASGTFNISTTVSLLLAAGGYKVAKHGNRSVTSKSGSADVLEALGINITTTPQIVEQCIEEIGVGFLFAPSLHTAMKYVAPVRKSLKIRTVFNLLGPLTNPANPNYQVIGVFDAKLVSPLIHVLKNLGLTSAYVVHGQDGLDEVTTTTNTNIAYLDNHGNINRFDFNPSEYGFQRSSLEDLKGGDALENAEIIRAILAGSLKGAKRDIIQINAGFAISAYDHCDLKNAFEKADALISSEKGIEIIEQLIAATN